MIEPTKEHLLPCPFCGREPEFIVGSGNLMPTLEEALLQPEKIRCSNGKCGVRYTPGGFTTKEWNQRSDTERIKYLEEQVGRLIEALLDRIYQNDM